jgi:hypothetical protein
MIMADSRLLEMARDDSTPISELNKLLKYQKDGGENYLVGGLACENRSRQKITNITCNSNCPDYSLCPGSRLVHPIPMCVRVCDDCPFPHGENLFNCKYTFKKDCSNEGTGGVYHYAGTIGKRQSSGGCYIASAVYDSYNCPQVWTLRRFRDNSLASNLGGRVFIRVYYMISPMLVKWLGNSSWFKTLWRNPLDKMVLRLQAKGIESTPYKDKGTE